MKSIVVKFFVCALALSSYAFGQINAGLTGTVSDASGALIPGVEVTAKNINTGIADTRLTNETGNFVFPSLQPGTYTLSAVLSGFQTASYNNVVLGQGQEVRLNFTLQVLTAAQSVDVSIAADTVLATTSASVGNVLPDHDVQTLPLGSRNVMDMIATTAGVINVSNSNASAPSFGGLPIGYVNTTRDGIVTNDGRYNSSNGAYSSIFTSPDMIEEVKVSSNSIDPALGRGAAQVQLRTRAGTNEFHGAAFYTNNNGVLNAQPWFSNLIGAQRNYTNRNQFGGRVGGPIIKNKAFFFFLIDDQRYLEKVLDDALVLTPTARQGIFQYLTQGATGANGGTSRRNGNAFGTTPSVNLAGKTLSSDPVTGAPLFLNSFNLFTDVKDPNRTQIDPVWFGPQYLTRMPLPNDWSVGDGLNTAGFKWQQPHDGFDGATGVSPNPNRNHVTVRFDYQVNTRHKVTFTMTQEKDWGVTGQTGLPDYPAGGFGDVLRVPYFYTLQWTATVSPTVLNEFRTGIKRDTWIGTSAFDKGCCYQGASQNTRTADAQAIVNSYPSVGGPSSSFLYLANTVSTPGPAGANVILGNYAPFGVASPRSSYSPFIPIADTMSFTKGAHSLQAGFEYDWQWTNQSNHGGQQETRPLASLGVNPSVPVPNLNTTNFKGLNSSDVSVATSLLANLAGSINTIGEQFFVNSPTATTWTDYRTSFLFYRNLHTNQWDLFFKDNWKATKDLTLLLGIRYDKYGVVYDADHLGGKYISSYGSGQAALFGCSGGSFAVMWQPGAGNCGSANPSLTGTILVGRDSANPGQTIYGNDWKDFGPSFGFSWSISRFKRTTVVRGGYGINYAGAEGPGAFSGSVGNLAGQTLNQTYTPSAYLDAAHAAGNTSLFPLAATSAAPFTPTALTNRTAGITGYADNRTIPYIQSFNLSVQRELTRSLALDIGWVGNKASRLFSTQQLNDTNIFENGILSAFNAVRAGQNNVPLMDQIFKGVTLGGAGLVNGTTLTAAQALRKSTSTNTFIATGDVGGFANFINTSTIAPGGQPGGLLRNAGLPENFIVVSPQFGSVSLSNNISSSTYHSLQAHVTKRVSQGFTGQFSYTWSKAIGDNGTRDQRNHQLSKGLLSADRTHVLVANGTWDLPFGSNRLFLSNAPAWTQRVIGGWQISSIASWTSGAPLTFTSSRGTLNHLGSNTADQAGALQKGDVVKGDGFVQYFANLKTQPAPKPDFGGDPTLPGVFTNQVVVDNSGNTILQNPVPGTTGNTPLALPTIKGPGTLTLNMALTKQIRITEGKTFTL
ncbi:MAG TPA: TonB-dependent receptor, partial [Terriglobia bacterium]